MTFSFRFTEVWEDPVWNLTEILSHQPEFPQKVLSPSMSPAIRTGPDAPFAAEDPLVVRTYALKTYQVFAVRPLTGIVRTESASLVLLLVIRTDFSPVRGSVAEMLALPPPLKLQPEGRLLRPSRPEFARRFSAGYPVAP